MIIFLCLFLITNVSAYEMNYMWYKYENSEYIKLEDALKHENSYIDYSDYIYEREKDDEYYSINKMKGNKIYITNWGSKAVDFENLKLLYNGEEIKYVWNKTYKRFPHKLVGYSTISVEYDNLYSVDDIEIVLECTEGNIQIYFSESYNYLKETIGTLKVSGPGTYKLDNVAKERYEIPKLYKTYYGRINGTYSPNSYDDFIYKDVDDYVINYYHFNNVITSYNEQIEDLIDTNYKLISYEHNIDYNKNGVYTVKLIFDTFEKEEEIYVKIMDNEQKTCTDTILDLNNKIEELKLNYEGKIKELTEQNNNLSSENSGTQETIKTLEEERKKLLEKTSVYEKTIEELNEKIIDLEKLNEELKGKEEKLNEKNDTLNNKNKDLQEEVKLLKNEINDLNIQNKKLTENYNTCYKNKDNYLDLVKLKNTCFEELNVLTNKINKLNKDYFYLNKTYDNDIDYYKRYISKLKLIIEEKDVDYWNINKCSSFVGFKLLK